MDFFNSELKEEIIQFAINRQSSTSFPTLSNNNKSTNVSLTGNNSSFTNIVNSTIAKIKKSYDNNKSNVIELGNFIVFISDNLTSIKEVKIKDAFLKYFYSVLEPCLFLKKLENDCFPNKMEMNVILKELSEGIKNIILINSCIKGLYSLLLNDLLKHLMNEINISTFFIEILNYESVPIPTYPQETRSYAYKILIEIINRYFTHIKSIDYFVILCLSDIEGEKDPRNLLLIFKLLEILIPKLNKETLSKHIETIMNLISDYYPIEFEPPKNSSINITQEDLSNSLNKAISSSPLLLKEMFELFKENLDGLSIDGKIEVFKTISCFYSSLMLNFDDSPEKITIKLNVLIDCYETLYDMIVSSVLNNMDEGLHIEAIKSFVGIVNINSELCQICLNNLTDDLINSIYLLLVKQISKISDLYFKLEDWIFSTEPVKLSYDSRDLLLVIYEYKACFTKNINLDYVKKISKNDDKIINFLNCNSLEKRCLNIFYKSFSFISSSKQFIIENCFQLFIYLLKKEKFSYLINFRIIDENEVLKLKNSLVSLINNEINKESCGNNCGCNSNISDSKTDKENKCCNDTNNDDESIIKISSTIEDYSISRLTAYEICVYFSYYTDIIETEFIRKIFTKLFLFLSNSKSNDEKSTAKICILLDMIIKKYKDFFSIEKLLEVIKTYISHSILESNNKNANSNNKNELDEKMNNNTNSDFNFDNLISNFSINMDIEVIRKYFILIKEISIDDYYYSKTIDFIFDIIEFNLNVNHSLQVNLKNKKETLEIAKLMNELILNIEIKNKENLNSDTLKRVEFNLIKVLEFSKKYFHFISDEVYEILENIISEAIVKNIKENFKLKSNYDFVGTSILMFIDSIKQNLNEIDFTLSLSNSYKLLCNILNINKNDLKLTNDDISKYIYLFRTMLKKISNANIDIYSKENSIQYNSIISIIEEIAYLEIIIIRLSNYNESISYLEIDGGNFKDEKSLNRSREINKMKKIEIIYNFLLKNNNVLVYLLDNNIEISIQELVKLLNEMYDVCKNDKELFRDLCKIRFLKSKDNSYICETGSKIDSFNILALHSILEKYLSNDSVSAFPEFDIFILHLESNLLSMLDIDSQVQHIKIILPNIIKCLFKEDKHELKVEFNTKDSIKIFKNLISYADVESLKNVILKISSVSSVIKSLLIFDISEELIDTQIDRLQSIYIIINKLGFLLSNDFKNSLIKQLNEIQYHPKRPIRKIIGYILRNLVLS